MPTLLANLALAISTAFAAVLGGAALDGSAPAPPDVALPDPPTASGGGALDAAASTDAGSASANAEHHVDGSGASASGDASAHGEPADGAASGALALGGLDVPAP